MNAEINLCNQQLDLIAYWAKQAIRFDREADRAIAERDWPGLRLAIIARNQSRAAIDWLIA